MLSEKIIVDKGTRIIKDQYDRAVVFISFLTLSIFAYFILQVISFYY